MENNEIEFFANLSTQEKEWLYAKFTELLEQKLSDILQIPEGVAFVFNGSVYKVEGDLVFRPLGYYKPLVESNWTTADSSIKMRLSLARETPRVLSPQEMQLSCNELTKMGILKKQ